ncbi:MAG: VacB/RNase II family 3'-5' exoribonuclease, partial [Oscillospiraceae bacterium]|nr:VacB/RNase II family 3'-5' exoribonuclease [Oscillospiraceae bacterium]
MPIKDRILKELETGPKKFKTLKTKFKGSKKFYAAMEDLYQKGIIDEKNGLVVLTKPVDKKAEKPKDVFEGTVVKLTENYGFVRVEEWEKDVFVAGKFMMGTVVGDVVEIKKIPSKRHQYEGEIINIVKEKTNLVAVAEKTHGSIYAVLRDCPVLCLPIENRRRDLQHGDVIVVDVFGRGRSHRALTAKIRENLGRVTTSQKAVDLLLMEKQVAAEFEDKVIAEVDEVVSRINMATEYKYREDLTGECIFTIDSASTKDIDDAVSIEPLGKGYKLCVHIADVSHYVRPKSALDMDAISRGTSVYYADQVIPMLPKELSNGICSLNPQEDRLAFSCLMKLDNDGKLVSYKFSKSVICSRVKGVYSEVNVILDCFKTGTAIPDELAEKYNGLTDTIRLMDELASILTANKLGRGAPQIETSECKIIVDENDVCIDVKKRERGRSEMIIEEFMLMANTSAARLAKDNGVPFVYRVHEDPAPEKVSELVDVLSRFGVPVPKFTSAKPRHLAEILEKTKDMPIATAINNMVLRSMAKAKYADEPLGHFGLVLEDYAHFTSPIRRYPDLAIHRILTDLCYNKQNVKYMQKR